MGATPVMFSGVFYPKGKAAGDKPVACTFIGNMWNPTLSVGGGPIIPLPPEMPSPPLIIWGPGDPRPTVPIAGIPGLPGGPPATEPLPPQIWGPTDPRPTVPIAEPPWGWGNPAPKPPDSGAVKPPPPDGGWGFFPAFGWGYFPGDGEASPKK